MKQASLPFVLILTSLLLYGGCERAAKAPDPRFTEAGGVNADKEEQKKRDFDNALELLGSLEDTPRLPEMPGYERLVQIGDRLDRWIKDRPDDAEWKADPTFLEIEKASRKAASTSREIVTLLQLLQDAEGVVDDEGKPLTASESKQDELKRVMESFSTLVGELTALAECSGVVDVFAFSRQVEDLQNKFDALVKRPNLNAGAIRSYTRQLETETARFANFAVNMEKYAAELRTEGVFMQLSDVEYLKQSVWLRDISNWARGDRQDLLERVTQLFDWTICNMELRDGTLRVGQDQAINLPQQYPWQSLLLGYGSLWDRTVLFIELLRQQRIDACLLAVPHPDDANRPLIWGVGVLLDGEIYVFIPQYGLPLPGPDGANLSDDAALAFPKIATLSQLLKDEKLIRQLDLSDEKPFPLNAATLAQCRAYLIAAPETVSIRMKMLETELSGEQNMVLYTNIHEQRRLFGAIPGIREVDVWKYPFRTKFEQMLMYNVTNELMAPFLAPSPKNRNFPLWKGRVLYFKGRVAGQDSAITEYQNARISDRDILEFRNDPTFRANPQLAMTYQMVTLYATYWLAVASFEAEGVNMMSSAKDFLERIRNRPINAWRVGTEYLLGRIAEREKRYTDAVTHYRRTASSPSGPGNELRARWLEKVAKINPPPSDEDHADSQTEEAKEAAE